MKNVLKSLLCTALIFFGAAATPAFSNDYVKFDGWKQAETTHFRFIYEAASEPAAQAYAKIADEAWEKIARVYSMPQEKTNVYVFSRLNIVNAYTFFAPPEIIMYDSPVLDSTFGFRDDWMKLFFTHELIHIANITFEDKNYLTSKLFGEAFRGMDYSMIPGWALEGLTTVLETELTNGGRGRSPYWELEYKAPTMDNALIPYRLIGTEAEPPYGQIYVMGYLIMRSIADRWGLQALADIERNRSINRSWEESVKLVTGHTPQDIYREVKIALEKKYAAERQIPEGKIISPNDMNTHYYKPAIIFDDGSLITIRQSADSDAMAVLLNPAADEGLKYYDESSRNSDENKSVRETILFTANFSDQDSITADENKTVYYTSAVSRYDRNPGSETQFPIFKWTQEDGSKQLTADNNSYYQPVVSRDGKILVAVEQKGLKMRLVQIDTETGAQSVLFEDPRYSFIQPAINADGTQLAFLILKDDRACVALADLSTKQYKIVNNTDYDFITDPSSPSFNKDGTLTFCSNDRGRLEIFEAKVNSDGQTFTYIPMLSDPIGALWAYKNDFGIFYTSTASTGNVIKIKPVEEWGNIPSFEGPSPSGQIITFGHLEDDYPDFNPYKAVAESQSKTDEQTESELADNELDFTTEGQTLAVENTEEEAASTDDETEQEDKSKEEKYKKRSPKKITQLENLDPGVTELTNEKTYFPMLQPYLYMPFFSSIEFKDDNYLGFGGFFAAMTPKLQMKTGILFLDAFYYPKIKNFTGDFFAELPIGTGALDLGISRNTSMLGLNQDKSNFMMNNIMIAGYTQPLYSREEKHNTKELKLVTYIDFSMSQKNEKIFAVTDNIPFEEQLAFHIGLDYSQDFTLRHDNTLSFSIVNLALGHFDFNANKVRIGYEGEYLFGTSSNSGKQEISLIARYTDFPSETVTLFSRAHFNGIQEDCLYPGKLLVNYSYSIPGLFFDFADVGFNVQGLASFGKNSDGKTPDSGNPLNFKLEKMFNLGAEISVPLGLGQKIAVGYSALFGAEDETFTKPKTNFYVTCKFNWLRF